MSHVLLTGANGFVGSHILDCLLEHGYSVTAVVRSQDKARRIQALHSAVSSTRLDFAIVPDICQDGSFHEAVRHDPPFHAVIHSASPFTFNVKDIETELLKPAIQGTLNVLRAIKDGAPSVKRLILTSSFAAIENPRKGPWPEHRYTEDDWSPLSYEDGLKNRVFGYLASKKLAERSAWDFINDESNGVHMTLTAINPPMVFGPVIQPLSSVDAINTSNAFIHSLVLGKHNEKLPPTNPFYWVDARDVALAHVKALETPVAQGQRFVVSAGTYSFVDICDIIRENLPQYISRLPAKETAGGELPAGGVAQVDASRAKKVLGIQFRSLKDSVIDVVRSMEAVGLVSPPSGPSSSKNNQESAKL